MILTAIFAVIAGTLISSFLALLPGLHIYNVMGLFAILLYNLQGTGITITPELCVPFAIGLVVGWSILNTIPSVLLGAPDESAIFTVLPGQRYLMAGRGHEGVMLIGTGSLIGIFSLILIIAPLAPKYLPFVRYVLTDHIHWILWIIITFILMSEWPKKGNHGPAGWRKFFSAWSTLFAGIITFILSGLLGFILFYRSPVSIENGFQNIMPAFVGLFAAPWCLLNMLSTKKIPPQTISKDIGAKFHILAQGAFAGVIGGTVAAFLPVVTGGIGGLLAGHATAQRDEKAFMISQGASKSVYYVGALMFFFVPGLFITRGGGAWIFKGFYAPHTTSDYFLALGAIAISASIAFLLMSPLTKFTLWLIKRVNYQLISFISILIIAGIVFVATKWIGLFIMMVGTGIGLLPILFGSRRINCLGVLLLPIACNMSGIGEKIASLLGLLQ